MVQTGLCQRVNPEDMQGYPKTKDSTNYDSFHGECKKKEGEVYVRRPRYSFSSELLKNPLERAIEKNLLDYRKY